MFSLLQLVLVSEYNRMYFRWSQGMVTLWFKSKTSANCKDWLLEWLIQSHHPPVLVRLSCKHLFFEGLDFSIPSNSWENSSNNDNNNNIQNTYNQTSIRLRINIGAQYAQSRSMTFRFTIWWNLLWQPMGFTPPFGPTLIPKPCLFVPPKKKGG